MFPVTAWQMIVGTAIALGIVTVLLLISDAFSGKKNNESFRNQKRRERFGTYA